MQVQGFKQFKLIGDQNPGGVQLVQMMVQFGGGHVQAHLTARDDDRTL